MSVPARTISQLFLFLLGSALVLSALLLQGGTTFDVSAQGSPASSATPTPDRLAQPTLPAVPSQADHGAQVYWLRCMACHGDKGQGLTEEFRQAYPPEDQNCWNSGCHGKRPYENGFTLPVIVPRLIGAGALQKFPTAAALQAFIAAAMPFSTPGSLSVDDAWRVTSFLLRENHLWDGTGELGPANADQVRITPPEAAVTPTPATAGPMAPLSAPMMVFGVLVAIIIWLLLRPARGHSPD